MLGTTLPPRHIPSLLALFFANRFWMAMDLFSQTLLKSLMKSQESWALQWHRVQDSKSGGGIHRSSTDLQSTEKSKVSFISVGESSFYSFSSKKVDHHGDTGHIQTQTRNTCHFQKRTKNRGSGWKMTVGLSPSLNTHENLISHSLMSSLLN